MEKRLFDQPSVETARSNLRALFDAYSAATGIPPTAVSEIVVNDRAFISRIGRTSLNFATFDRVVGHFSFIWPKGQAWPAGVPRLAPLRLPDKSIRAWRGRVAASRSMQSPVPPLPGDAAWPDDIPKPGATATAKMEARNG